MAVANRVHRVLHLVAQRSTGLAVPGTPDAGVVEALEELVAARVTRMLGTH